MAAAAPLRPHYPFLAFFAFALLFFDSLLLLDEELSERSGSGETKHIQDRQKSTCSQ